MNALLHGAVAAFVTGSVVWSVRRYAIRRNVVDYPNARSSHERPTPRGGGLGIVVCLIAFLIATSGGQEARWLMVGAIVVVATVGWIDDHRSLPSLPRLLVHAITGIAVAWVARSFHLEIVPGWSGAAAFVWWVFWTTSAINVTNFMDGIDAIIGLQLLVFAAFSAVALRADPWGHSLAVVSLGAAIGFLVFNWPPARIFMGDVGSGSIGVVFVVLGMLTMATLGWSVVHAFLPLMPLFVDESFTMLQRLRRRESLLQPHRTHVYQRLVQAGWPHARVSVLYALASIASGLWALTHPTWTASFLAGAAGLLILTVGVAAIPRPGQGRSRIVAG